MDHPGCDGGGSEEIGDDRKEPPAEEESEQAVAKSRSGGGDNDGDGGCESEGRNIVAVVDAGKAKRLAALKRGRKKKGIGRHKHGHKSKKSRYDFAAHRAELNNDRADAQQIAASIAPATKPETKRELKRKLNALEQSKRYRLKEVGALRATLSRAQARIENLEAGRKDLLDLLKKEKAASNKLLHEAEAKADAAAEELRHSHEKLVAEAGRRRAAVQEERGRAKDLREERLELQRDQFNKEKMVSGSML